MDHDRHALADPRFHARFIRVVTNATEKYDHSPFESTVSNDSKPGLNRFIWVCRFFVLFSSPDVES